MYEGQYRALYERLGVPLAESDGIEEDEVAAAEYRVGVRAPDALREYYRVAGRESRLNQAHNRLLAPSAWARHGDRLLFLEENQGVVVWAVDIGSSTSDPPVVQGNGTPLEWYPEHPACSSFLGVMLHWQAVTSVAFECAGSASAPAAARHGLDAALVFAGEVTGLRAYSCDCVALCLVPWDTAFRLFVAGPNDASVARVSPGRGARLGGLRSRVRAGGADLGGVSGRRNETA